MKHRIPGKLFIPLALIVILGAFMMVIPINFDPKPGVLGLFHNGFHQLMNVMSHLVVWIVFFIALLMLLIVNALNRIIEARKYKKLSVEEQSKYIEEKKLGYLKRVIRSGRERQSEEEEQEIILDHGFDGITELDNSLPQWWLSLFYFGCVFMVIYVISYFTTNFAHPLDEYEAETARLESQFEIWREENDITVDGATNMFEDETALAHGKEIFTSICATCHTANGGGAAGPNLTDDYWINHQDDNLYLHIYKMVYDGSPNNPAMQAFGQTKQLSGLDIQDVASYVFYLNQVAPPVTEAEGGLAPQGDLAEAWKDDTAATMPGEGAESGETTSEAEPSDDANENLGEQDQPQSVQEVTDSVQ